MDNFELHLSGTVLAGSFPSLPPCFSFLTDPDINKLGHLGDISIDDALKSVVSSSRDKSVADPVAKYSSITTIPSFPLTLALPF
jgi:hypothetical protein